MALTIKTERGETGPISMYFVENDQPTLLKLTVTGAESNPPIYEWTLKDENGDPVQDPAPGLLRPTGDVVTVPIFAKKGKALTLTLNEQGFAGTGDFKINATHLKSFSLSPVPGYLAVGDAISLTATILDTDSNPANGVELGWYTSSGIDDQIIPADKIKVITDSADPTSFSLLTAPILYDALDKENKLTIFAQLGEYSTLARSEASFVPFENLVRPESVLPLSDNTIDDAIIDAVEPGGIPFKIPRIRDVPINDGFFLTLYHEYDNPNLGGPLKFQWFPKGSTPGPYVMYAPIQSGQFDFTGPVSLRYTLSSATGDTKGRSEKLALKVRRTKFPRSTPEDAALPRPWPSKSSYNKDDLDRGSELIVEIPLQLDFDSDDQIFKEKDEITVKFFLTGYTTANENVTKTLSIDAYRVKATDLQNPNKGFLSIEVKSDTFKKIEGSMANVYYELARVGEKTKTSPSGSMVIDTVAAYSGSSVVEAAGKALSTFRPRRKA